MENTSMLSLSANAIEDLIKITFEGKSSPTKEVDMILQIHAIKKTLSLNTPNITYTATLADMSYKYTGFIIIKSNDNSQELNSGDIIRLKAVSCLLINNDKIKAFIVKSYEVLASNSKFLSNPEPFKCNTNTNTNTNDNQNNNNSNSTINNINKDNNSQEEDNRVLEPNNQFDDEEPQYSTNNNNNSNNINSDVNTNNNTQSKPSMSNHHSGNTRTMLLSQITSFSKDITLYVKVIKKWEVKNFLHKQTKQPGKLLSFNIADIEGFQMQVTCFGSISDKFSNIIKEKGVYLIRGGYARLSAKQYTNIKSDYKLIIDDKTRIDEMEDNGQFKDSKISISELKDLPFAQPNGILDCVVYVIEAYDKTIKHTKGGDMFLRKIIIGDVSGYKCELTLWRKFAEMDIHQGDILFLKYVRVGDYNGRALGTVDDTIITPNPNMPERNALEEFLMSSPEWIPMPNKNNMLTESSEQGQGQYQTNTIYIKELLDSLSESNESPLSKIKGTICTITHSERNFYAGCPIKTCKKKLALENDGWHCLLCNKTFDKPYYYYTLSVRVKDASGEHWIDLFGETVAKLFGIECEEYKDYVLNKDDIKLQQLTTKIEFKTYYFIGKGKVHIYNNNPKKKFSAYRYEAINKIQEAKHQIKVIKTQLMI